MKLVEQHIITKSHKDFNQLDNLCFLSKNLYNAALYEIRQYYFINKKYLNKFQLINNFTKNKQPDYIKLPAKVSQQVIYLVDQNFKSFFNKLKKNKDKTKKIKIPKYLDKLKGRQCLIYTKQAISKKLLKNGIINLSKTNLKFKTLHKDINQIRIIHKGNYLKLEIVYNITEKQLKPNNNRYCSIDLGVNNLATISSNVIKPIIINGKPLKSINQYFNKRKSQLQSKLINKYSSKRINSITLKRNNKIKDYLHKSSRLIINHLVSNSINILIIGKNKDWKQEINIGRVNNQNFVNIPHSLFISMLKYKAKLEGIAVIVREESYTSKCSFIDNEEIKKHEEYMGKRIKRGLFRSKHGIMINADLNGSLNILRKAVPNIFNEYGIEVYSTPLVLTIK